MNKIPLFYAYNISVYDRQKKVQTTHIDEGQISLFHSFFYVSRVGKIEKILAKKVQTTHIERWN